MLLLWLFIWFDFKSNFLVISWILKSFFTLKCRTITKSSLMRLWSSFKLCQHAVNSIIKVQLQYSTAHQVAPAHILGITALTHSLLGYISQWYSALSMVATKITLSGSWPKGLSWVPPTSSCHWLFRPKLLEVAECHSLSIVSGCHSAGNICSVDAT